MILSHGLIIINISRYLCSSIVTTPRDNVVTGVSHGDDTQYAIQIGLDKEPLKNTTPEEQRTMDFMTDLWATFARTG